MSDIQRLTLIALRRSDLDNLRLDVCQLLACQTVGCDFRLFPLIAAAMWYILGRAPAAEKPPTTLWRL